MVNDTMVTGHETSQWLTLPEVSAITGKSVNALNLLIRRQKFDKTRKISGKGQGKWLIHKDSLDFLLAPDQLTGQLNNFDQLNQNRDQSKATIHDQSNPLIPFEYYEKKRDEWDRERDQLMSGIMMYRYKFEELDRKVKALPAPPEIVSEEIRQKDVVIKEAQKVLQDAHEAIVQKDEALVQAQKIIAEEQIRQQQQEEAMEQLRVKLQKEEQAKEEYRIQWELAQAELKRPWWKMALIAIGMWKI